MRSNLNDLCEVEVGARLPRAIDLHAFLLGGVTAELPHAAPGLRPELVDEAPLLGRRLAQQFENLVSEIGSKLASLKNRQGIKGLKIGLR